MATWHALAELISRFHLCCTTEQPGAARVSTRLADPLLPPWRDRGAIVSPKVAGPCGFIFNCVWVVGMPEYPTNPDLKMLRIER